MLEETSIPDSNKEVSKESSKGGDAGASTPSFADLTGREQIVSLLAGVVGNILELMIRRLGYYKPLRCMLVHF
jgi:hypothetical protein